MLLIVKWSGSKISSLEKQVIDVLGKEEDNNLLAEVLDFYGYLKAKKRKDVAISCQTS